MTNMNLCHILEDMHQLLQDKKEYTKYMGNVLSVYLLVIQKQGVLWILIVSTIHIILLI